EREAHVLEDLFDLLERLAAEVLRLEHVLLRPLNELTDEGDVRVLEAVRRTNRELELVDRAEEVLVERLVLGRALDVASLLGLLEVDEDRELLLEDLRGVRDRVLRLDRAVRPDLERELVVVGDLPDARV